MRTFDDDGVEHVKASFSLTLGRQILLRWSIHYDGDPWGPVDERRQVHRVHSLAGFSPSPWRAALKLRALRIPRWPACETCRTSWSFASAAPGVAMTARFCGHAIEFLSGAYCDSCAAVFRRCVCCGRGRP